MTEQETAGADTAPRKNPIMRWAPLLIIATALVTFFATGQHQKFNLEFLQENRQALTSWVEANPILSIGVFIAAYAAAVAISFPGASILTIFGGFLFGIWPGVPAVVFGATIGSFIIYLVARNASDGALSQKTGGFIKKMEEGFRENELSYMFLLRLIPVFPFWGVNIGAGIAGVKARNYLLGTFFGIIPGTFVYTGVGATAGDAFDAGEQLTLSGLLLKPQTLAILAVFAALAIAPIFFKARTQSTDE